MWYSTRSKILAVIIVFFGLTQTAPAAMAQSGWQHSVDVYILFSEVNGTVGIGPIETEMDVSFSELIENLDGGFLASYRGETDRFAFGADLIWLRLNKEGTTDSGLLSAGMTMNQLIVELHGMYRLIEQVEVYAGVRYWYIDTDITATGEFEGGSTSTVSLTENWVDPIVGVRGVLPLSSKVRLIARGDIGGFGIGSDFAWHLSGHVQWRLGGLVSAIGGYRIIDAKYESGTGSDFFLMDVTVQGPMAGVTFSF
jgi:hypothetical protein